MKIVIKKRSTPEWLTLLIAVFPFFIAFLTQFLRLPSLMKYVLDVAWCAVLVVTMLQGRLNMKKQLSPFMKLIVLFFLYTFVAYLFNYQSAVYYLWGFRNNFRYYVAFLAFAVYLRQRDVNAVLKLMDGLFWINAVVTFFQFFVLGCKQDYLGGIFGVERGCNGYSMIFFAVVVSKSVLQYMNGQEKALPCFLKSGLSLIIAAMAELKMFFVVFPMIMVLSAMLTKFSVRKFWLMFFAAILVMVGSSLLATIFGSSNELSIKKIIELMTASSYATGEDLGRFTAIPKIATLFLTDLPGRLFGMGLGNCETSSFAICNTPFFKSYSYLHYTWFSSACLFLETGFVGLGINLSFFVLSFFTARKRLKSGDSTMAHCQIAMIMAVLCVILTFYNASLRADVGYVAYFALALPFIRE